MSFDIRILRYGVQAADQFAANPRNPRKHPQRQRDAVQASLGTLGWIAPVVVNRRTGYVVDGHERIWQALKKNSDVPFVEVDLTEEEEALALATFDWITYLAQYDQAILSDLLKEVHTEEAALQAVLLDLEKETGLLARIEEEPFDAQAAHADALLEKWQCRSGQLWEIKSATASGAHRLLCGDALNEDHVERALAGRQADLCFTDPMYNIDRESFARFFEIARRRAKTVGAMAYGYVCARFAEWVGAWNFEYVYLTSSGVFFPNRPVQRHKLVVFWMSADSHYDKYARSRLEQGTSVVEFPLRETTRETEFAYIKPISSFRHFIEIFAPPGGLVLDPFCGSGTAIAASEQIGRLCAGIEIDPGACAIALERMSRLGLEPKLRAEAAPDAGMNA